MNTTSNSKASLFLHVEKLCFFVGEIVRGTIQLDVKAPLNLHQLTFQLVAREKSEKAPSTARPMAHGDTPSAQATHHRIVSVDMRDFFNVSAAVPDFSGLIQPGQYLFPFEVALPMESPPSCACFFTDNGAGASSNYSVGAFVSIHDAPGLFMYQPFVVLVKSSTEPLPATVRQTKALKRFCCLSSGSVEMKAVLSSQNAVVGQPLHVEGTYSNHSSARFDQATIEIRRSVRYRVNGSSKSLKHTVMSAEIALQPQRSGSFNIDFTLPMDHTALPATLKSALIEVKYDLKVSLRHNKSFIAQPAIYLPFQMLHDEAVVEHIGTPDHFLTQALPEGAQTFSTLQLQAPAPNYGRSARTLRR